jgi:Fanconi anemia group M protein
VALNGRQRRLDEFRGGAEPEPPPPRPAALPGVWRIADGFVEHPLLAARTLRALPFQIDFARIAISEDLLVVLPTGLGKTVIAALAAAEILRRGTGKVVFLAPTRPLVRQHSVSFRKWFTRLSTAVFTGTVAHPVREGAWESAEAIFSTPELVVNDLAHGRYDLKDVGFLIFDEAHHAVGKYAYVAIAQRFGTERPKESRLLGLTASPGGKDERIEEVVGVLGVQRIEARSRDDEGVKEFVQPVQIDHVWVQLPEEIRTIQERLRSANHEEARRLQKMGYLRTKPIASLSVKDLISLRAEIFARPGPMVRKFGPLFHALVLLHLHHAVERLETQGLEPFVRYVERVGAKEKLSRGDKAFVQHREIVKSVAEARRLLGQRAGRSHPKLDALAELLDDEFGIDRGRPPRILVFAQFRDTVQGIQEHLEARGWKAGRFVGQATRDKEDVGMNQKEQARVLDEFREGRFPILVASSVAEEGLDVPDVDLVVFFESIPSEIRAIQRRGRTGRSSLGRVVLLLTEATRDVSYQKAEDRREKAMGRIVRRLSRESRNRSRTAKGDPSPAAPGGGTAGAPAGAGDAQAPADAPDPSAGSPL